MAVASPVRRGHLTVVEVCAELGIARSTLYDWRAARMDPACFNFPTAAFGSGDPTSTDGWSPYRNLPNADLLRP